MTERSVKKKTRGPHWLPDDRSLLLRLVLDNKEVILCQKNTSAVVHQKMATWKKITDQLNNQAGGVKREWAKVKKCWENMVASSRRNYSKFKTESGKTDGGRNPVKLSAEDVAVMQIYGSDLAVHNGASFVFNSENSVDEILNRVEEILPSGSESISVPLPVIRFKAEAADNDDDYHSSWPTATSSAQPNSERSGEHQFSTPASSSCLQTKKRPFEADESVSKRSDVEEISQKDKLACEVLELEKTKLEFEIEYLKAAKLAQDSISSNNFWQQKRARLEIALMLKENPSLSPAEMID